ncbi:hypothetical protein ACOSQ3_032227 [Xanthoceras sorbifolium]
MMERCSIQKRYFDPQFDGFALPYLDDLFDDNHQKEEEKEEVSNELVTMGALKWRKGRAPFEKPRSMDS